jgi:NAD(P)-dependent dehydrogenase (short-subunit alcohol dehydrogenase family)
VNWSFKDKVALVTGAASGIGLATAKAFAEAGAAVMLADVDEDAVRSAVEELVAASYKAIAIRCNVADEAEVAAMVEQTVSAFGRLDAAFNNAQSPAVETADASGEEFDRVNAINLRGVWNCMKYELRQMREQESGAIVNCSSIGGLIGIAGRAAYHASKHGVLGLTKSAALEYASQDLAAEHIEIDMARAGESENPLLQRLLPFAILLPIAAHFARFNLGPGSLIDTVDDLKVLGSNAQGCVKEPIATSFSQSKHQRSIDKVTQDHQCAPQKCFCLVPYRSRRFVLGSCDQPVDLKRIRASGLLLPVDFEGDRRVSHIALIATKALAQSARPAGTPILTWRFHKPPRKGPFHACLPFEPHGSRKCGSPNGRHIPASDGAAELATYGQYPKCWRR